MATMTLIQPATKPPAQPRARLRAGAYTLDLPFAPTGSSLGGWANTFDTTARPGRRPLVQLTGIGIPTLSLAFTVANRDWTQSIENWLTILSRIAGSGSRVSVLNLSPKEAGPWRMTGCDVTVTQRQPGTNDATRADVTLTFTYAVDPVTKLGPVSGGKKPTHGKGKSSATKSKTRHYVVRHGDTLSKIAHKFYGEPGKWPQIAKANKITHPRSLKVGRKLTIPPEK